MLVIGRKVGQSVLLEIGDVKIIVMLTEIRQGSVGLGFDAPSEVRISRAENLHRRKPRVCPIAGGELKGT